MSAPPGWHPQPDGRDRWWDGQQWTDHFRDPVQPSAPDPTAAYGTPPPYTGDPATGSYSTPTSYGAPGGAEGQWPPPKQGMSSGAKGCLIAAVVVVVLVVVAVVVGGIFLARTANRVADDIRSAVPSSSLFPTDLPGGGEPVEVSVGEGFELGSATVEPGWTLGSLAGVGATVDGMTVTFGSGDAGPVLFSMDFDNGASTTCTASPADGSGTGDVSCLPMVDDAPDDGARVTVTPRF
ncbi:DUF2510 domain-containing protein [Phycicoccus sp. MAQZ13P-2]|uniref:DUF2510 domain-containing protein n=1 Tax=Phycicoccus mangrovi TaxID=2840470 RepID=UPI001BFFEA9B|nr:DUF2510 domain-containing protein [Phycicoccus mangrovi]MBT9255529.1 DUF2510 domain-containing protein [Phycicoccus mangrovi]MBT9275243.1 DUF2510 domain-containing protein [Phycicoccus mangrovi]